MIEDRRNSPAMSFYRSRDYDGSVILNRRSTTKSLTGLFYCQVPDATGVEQRVNVHISELIINLSNK